MRRRGFIAGAASLIASRGAAHAQTIVAKGKIGYLHPRTIAPDAPTLTILRPVWEGLGYTEPETVLLRSAEGDPQRLPKLADELIDLGAKVLIAVGPAAVKAASRSGATSVVAIDLETDPVRSGLAASLGRPGGNVTGLFLDQPSLAGKMIDLLKEAVPKIARVVLVWSPGTTQDQLDAAIGAARTRGLEVAKVENRGPDEYESAFRSLGGHLTTGVVQLGSPGFSLDAKSLAAAAEKYRLPTVAYLKFVARDGCLMSYGPNQEVYFARAVVLADRILKGERPGELPIERPTLFELIVNLKTAKALGLEMPLSLLARADEVIE